MKVGRILLWVKRLMIFILLVAIVVGYLIYHHIRAEREYQESAKYALVTAQVWIATARFHREPEQFIVYRDSVLKVHHLSKESMQDYLDRYKNRTEKYDLFTKLVKQFVDSLCSLETSSSQEGTTFKKDSIKVTR